MSARRTTASHDPTRRPGPQSDAGYILAQSALLLIPLMLFAALATDLGFWYAEGQRTQRAADAAALAGASRLPDPARVNAEARKLAERNGFVDATPGDNNDFDTGPAPQIEVNIVGRDRVEVRIRREVTSFFGRLVLDKVPIERFAVAENVSAVHLGNPTSGLGTGTIPQSALGVPPDRMWLAVNAYCFDHENGDLFLAGYSDGPVIYDLNQQVCGPTPNAVSTRATPSPTFDGDGYTLVAQVQAGSGPVDIDIYDPGTLCPDTVTPDYGESTLGFHLPRIYWRVYGPSLSSAHQDFLDTNQPIAQGTFRRDACAANSPNGDGWWPMATNLPNPGPQGGFYYVRFGSRNPSVPNQDPADSFWTETYTNSFGMRVTAAGSDKLCVYSVANTMCPQLYALDWLSLYRTLPNDEAAFYLAEIADTHAGETMTINFFDAAEGIDNIQFVDPAGNALPFDYRYADTSVARMSSAEYRETAFTPTLSVCSFGNLLGLHCLDTSNEADFNDHLIQVRIKIPDDYTCVPDCWWTVRYVTADAPTDRSTWSVSLNGSPLRLVE